MTLFEALQQTGCAIWKDQDCTTSVERLPDETFLLMTRRGVSILNCSMCSRLQIEAMRYLDGRLWQSAQVIFLYDIPR